MKKVERLENGTQKKAVQLSNFMTNDGHFLLIFFNDLHKTEKTASNNLSHELPSLINRYTNDMAYLR